MLGLLFGARQYCFQIRSDEWRDESFEVGVQKLGILLEGLDLALVSPSLTEQLPKVIPSYKLSAYPSS